MTFPKLTFNKIENGLIFTSDFSTFIKNNVISFSNSGISVIYGPNGTGKTSLAKVLSGNSDTAMCCEYNGTNYDNGIDIFHVINDQNNRNIIAGTAQDFLLGDNIKREFELQKQIDELYKNILSETIAALKEKFAISTTTNPLINIINNNKLSTVIKDLANKNSKGSKISIEFFNEAMSCIGNTSVDDGFSADKFKCFLAGYSDKKSLLHSVLALEEPDITTVHNAQEIEENSAAIEILSHFKNKTKCIVCDSDGINSEELIDQKTKNRQAVIDSLTKQMQGFIDGILKMPQSEDVFKIRENILLSLEYGDYDIIKNLQRDILKYSNYFNAIISGYFKKQSNIVILKEMYMEYSKLISEKPDITEEDFIYIEEILSNSMDKKIAVRRDENKNIKILLEEREFLGKDREEHPLSTGEQNFLSLCFEFLKAKNSPQKIVVLDDPISSFDSIYKNKVVFAMVKMLENKPRIILTHNIDLLRLLESQYKNSFRLYLLNNTEGENNGFIALSKNEQSMLINLQELLNTFRHTIFNSIKSPEMYLISMIPFMRGYATVIDDTESIEKLTELMHGYKTKSIDVSEIYFKLFGDAGKNVLPASFKINVGDLLSRTVDGVTIVDTNKYPLLDKTLRHSFTYLFLRLLVEKTLIDKYGIDTEKYQQLGAIINQSFKGNDIDSIRNRVRLTSKKTLINEFNHFEGNLSIFQPAIDITEKALGAEKTSILTFVDIIKQS